MHMHLNTRTGGERPQPRERRGAGGRGGGFVRVGCQVSRGLDWQTIRRAQFDVKAGCFLVNMCMHGCVCLALHLVTYLVR